MTINACIVGYGLSAKIFHLPFLLSSPTFTLHSIIQRNPPASPTAKGQSAPADFPSVTHYRSFDEALANPDIHLIIITSIPSTHYTMTRAALEAGKHVLCEKPFVPSAKEADDLAALAKTHNKILAVYQNRRWDADFLTLRRLVEAGTLGRVVELETHFDRHRPAAASTGTWKVSADEPAGGAIYDLGTHLLDQMVALFGVPSHVTALVANQRVYPAGSVGGDLSGDSFTVLLRWKARPGLLVTAKAGVVSPVKEQLRFLVKGEKASWRKEGMDPQEAQLHKGLRPAAFKGAKYFEGEGASSVYGHEGEDRSGVLTSAEGEETKVEPVVQTYVEFYKQLGDAIDKGAPSPVSAKEAADTLRVVEAALLSSREGRTVEL